MPDSEALFAAIREGDAAAVDRLLTDDPALVRARNAAGTSAISMAVFRGRSELVALFERHGAKLDVFEAAAAGRIDRLRALLAEDRTRANAVSKEGYYPLSLASFFGHEEAVALLLDADANVDSVSQNAQRVTPLHGAAAGPKPVRIAALLLARGANVDAKQEQDITPLHEAARRGDAELITLLVRHGASLDARTASGATAYDLAVQAGHKDVAERLLRPAICSRRLHRRGCAEELPRLS